MRKFIQFLFTKVFLINLVIAVSLVLIAFYAINAYLKSTTLHGEKIAVPMLIGKTTFQVDSLLLKEDLKYVIIDSVFDETAAPGEVLEQIPTAFQDVKPGRTIYLTINTVQPPNVALPNLKNMSLRTAVATLEVLGLKLHKLEYEPDICVDCVLRQQYQGEDVDAGTLIPKGSALTLVLGQGTGGADVQVPYLIGLNLEEAVRMLIDKSLNVGDVAYEACETRRDSNYAKVMRQVPGFYAGNRLTLGSEISLWFTGDTASVVRLNADSILDAYKNAGDGVEIESVDVEEENNWDN